MSATAPRSGTCPVMGDEAAAGQASAAPVYLAAMLDRVAHDLAAYRRLAAAGDVLAGGAALAAAHGILALATAPLSSQGGRDLRRAALGEALPGLAEVGLGHVAGLVAAALDLELHPVTLVHARGRQ